MIIRPEALFERFTARELDQILETKDAPSDHPRLLAACKDASAIAESYLIRAYPLPLPHIPAVLIAYCADIARYRLHQDQGINDGDSTIRKRYEDALQWLEKVGLGKIPLFPPPPANAQGVPFPVVSVPGCAVVSSPVVYTQERLDQWLA